MNFQTHQPSPLTYGAIGDSYGFCFEFVSAEFVDEHNDLCYHQHPEFADVKPGVYSDDTQMQLALAELMVSGADWTPENIANQFVYAYKRDPRPGYAKRFRSFLEEVTSGSEFIARIKPDSDRNGAAMRAAVIGLHADLHVVIERARVQAAVTHNTWGGICSSVASALMCHFFAYNLGDKQMLPMFLSEHVPDYPWSQPWQGSVPVHGMSTVHAALTALLATNSHADLLKRSIAFTGDVDSIATIACACASASPLFARDLPDELWDGVESSNFGIAYLRDMDRKLWSCVTGASL